MKKLAFLSLCTLVTLGATAHAQDPSSIRIDAKTAWSTMDAVDQYALLRHGQDSQTTASYIADALEDKLTALGHFGYAAYCITADNDPVQWALCQTDLDAFNEAKLNAEIDADTKHSAFHDGLKKAVQDGKAAFAAHAAKVKALFAKDDAYKTMFDLAASTRKAWAAKKNTSLRELTLAMDDLRLTQSRKAAAGCEDKTWAAWKTAISAVPAKRFSLAYERKPWETVEPAMAVVVGDADGYLAAVAFSACAMNSDAGLDYLSKTATQALLFWPGYRGPRNAAQLAIMQASIKLDDRNAQLAFPKVDRRALFTGNGNGGNWSSSGGYVRAPVVTMKASGNKTHLTFGPTKSVETQCVDYHKGTRLSRIESDGRLVYESSCGKYAKVTVTDAPAPAKDTLTRYVAGVKPGMTAMFLEDVLLITITNLAATQPAIVFGAPVK